MNTNIEVLRELDELVEAARLLGVTQAKKGFGCYTDADSRFERAMYESIDKHRAALLAERDALAAEVERLVEALKKVAQSLEWYAHGRCRGFDDGAPLPTNEAVELAERTLAKVRAEQLAEDAAWCAECGVKLENVRPGKHQHPTCSQAQPLADEVLLRQALEALDSDHPDIQLRTAIAVRERLGLRYEPEPNEGSEP